MFMDQLVLGWENTKCCYFLQLHIMLMGRTQSENGSVIKEVADHMTLQPCFLRFEFPATAKTHDRGRAKPR